MNVKYLFRHKTAEKFISNRQVVWDSLNVSLSNRKKYQIEIRMSMKKCKEPEVLTVWISIEISVSYYLIT